MLVITNHSIFSKVVSNAIEAAITNAKTDELAKRWENAITKGVSEIETNPYITWDADKKGLLIMSADSNNIYAANGVCQCKAFAQNLPCYHRAAARVWRLYLEALETVEVQAEPVAQKDALYIKRDFSGQKSEFMGGIRI